MDHMKKLLLAVFLKSSMAPFSRPFPEPLITTSMKIPQNTPNTVRAVRSLLALSTWRISRH
jgi:hypothetical protein